MDRYNKRFGDAVEALETVEERIYELLRDMDPELVSERAKLSIVLSFIALCEGKVRDIWAEVLDREPIETEDSG